MIQLRPNTNDLAVFTEVFLENEYRLPDRMDGMLVIDVGAHIGTFTLACRCRGADFVHAFESDPENFARLVDAAFGARVSLRYAAVWRSDKPEAKIRVGPHPYLLANPAAGGAFVPRPMIDVKAIALDDIIQDTGQVNILKLDCEGSEYPIILTSYRLDEIPAICGEWHTLPSDKAEALGLGECSPYRLQDHLTGLGYTCEFVQQADYPFQGLFWAWRRKNPFKPTRR